MLPLLRSELFRLSRRPMPWILLAVVAGGVVLVYALLWLTLATQPTDENAGLRNDLALVNTRATGLGIASFFASIVTVILGASIVGTEYGWGTIRALLPRSRSRIALMGAKLATLLIFDIVMIVGGFLAALAMSALVTAAEDLSESENDVVVESILAIGRTVYTLLPYSALAFCVAVLTRSNAAGIGIGLVILLAESLVVAILTAVTDLFDWLGDLLFTENTSAIIDLNDGFRNSTDLPDPWVATAVLGFWVVAFVAVAIVVFSRRDVTSGS